MRKPNVLLTVLLFTAYPIIIFFGLKVLEPRYVAVSLAVILIFRWKQDAQRFVSLLSKLNFIILAALLVLICITFITNSETLLRVFPAVMNLGMLLLFGLSLVKPPSMIEMFARIRRPDLPPSAVAYTRKVTRVWCVFFIVNGSIAVYTAFYASQDTWSLYNGLIAYVAMGMLIAGELLVRHYMIARETSGK